eukprot:GHVR01185243.1.p1 GENE.GHVR01185243.1~~GHVR01185243.1.p1  ORF type:complete len:284 (+),score=40.29 GHVR01185243.1:44-853(+)
MTSFESFAGTVTSSFSEAVTPIASSVLPIIQATGGALALMVFNLTSIEIVRDFWQVLSLFFAGLKEAIPDAFKTFYGNVSEFFSMCFTCWIPDIDYIILTRVLFILKLILSVVCCIWLYCGVTKHNNDRSRGLQTISWNNSRKMNFIIKFLSFTLTTLYLPVARDVIQIFTCDTSFFALDEECDPGTTPYLIYLILAVIPCLVYLLPLPIVFYKLIQKNKPKPKLYDSSGNLRAGGYTLHDYREDLDRDISPYKSLYAPYEQQWAFFKV